MTYFRPNAGIVVFNCKGEVLLCERNDIAGSWQFPQGGIEKGETPKEAALRELKEETSLINVQPVKTLNEPCRYFFPPEVLKSVKNRGFKNAGQDIFWTLVYFSGSDEEINLKTENPEFVNFCWASFDEACRLIVDFKKEAYKIANLKFSPLIKEFLSS